MLHKGIHIHRERDHVHKNFTRSNLPESQQEWRRTYYVLPHIWNYWQLTAAEEGGVNFLHRVASKRLLMLQNIVLHQRFQKTLSGFSVILSYFILFRAHDIEKKRQDTGMNWREGKGGKMWSKQIICVYDIFKQPKKGLMWRPTVKAS